MDRHTIIADPALAWVARHKALFEAFPGVEDEAAELFWNATVTAHEESIYTLTVMTPSGAVALIGHMNALMRQFAVVDWIITAMEKATAVLAEKSAV